MALLDFNAAMADPEVGGQDGINRLSNAARSPADYLLATVLPERDVADYTARGGSMIVRSTMAGAIGLDSVDPEGGAMQMSRFMHDIAKIGISGLLQEQTMIELQQRAQQLLNRGESTNPLAVLAILNFVQKYLLQPHYDRREWLRKEALFFGEVDWQFNGADLKVDYGIPSGNIAATATGNNAYGGSTSLFWTHWKFARMTLGASFRGAITSRDTVDEIITNPVNKIIPVSDDGVTVSFVKYEGDASGLRPQSIDARERGTLVAYDKEGEVWDVDNPGKTKKVRISGPHGVLGFFGSDDRSSQFIPDEGSTEDPDNDRALGYSHIGPTVEGDGNTGIWTRVYVPENMPQHLAGNARGRFLPVIENPNKIVLTSTEMP
jgi:hypothetical protein